NDGLPIDEAAEVVDVTVRVVAVDPAREPDHVGHAEEVSEDQFVICPREAGIADLDRWVEQALLRRHERARAVDVDRSPFEDDFTPLDVGRKRRTANHPSQPRRHASVLTEVGIARPPVESEADDRELQLAGSAAHEGRAGVPRPAAVGRYAKELDSGEIDA